MTDALQAARERLEVYVSEVLEQLAILEPDVLSADRREMVRCAVQHAVTEIVMAARLDGVATWQSGKPF